ncbi:hypothetical protein ACX40Y_00585 [Sphingomonas sp. RS6]
MLLPNTRVPGTRIAPTRMTAGLYLELRRKAAGLTRYDLARRLSQARAFPLDRAAALRLIEQLERPGTSARHREVIAAIARIIPLDVAVYDQLANDPADRHPTVCMRCGCSADAPCTGAAGVCTLERGTCTRCQSGAAQ